MLSIETGIPQCIEYQWQGAGSGGHRAGHSWCQMAPTDPPQGRWWCLSENILKKGQNLLDRETRGKKCEEQPCRH